MSPSHPFHDPIDPDALRGAGFATIEMLDEVESTMDRSRELAANQACRLPAAVIADRQTRGRGRRGARWWQPAGSLAVSLVLETASGLPSPTWSLACGIALTETLRAVAAPVDALVRWPNDVEVAGRKLAGILVEAVADGHVIFGIGVNTTGTAATAPVGLAHRITTIPDLTGAALPRERLLVTLLPRLRELLGHLAADPAVLPGRYRPLCALHGQPVTIHAGDGRHSGVCRGIATDGALLIDTAAGRQRFVSGSLSDPADAWRGDG